jgi:hypothetical protein
MSAERSYSVPELVSIIREPDDQLASVRISLGRIRKPGPDGVYLVFRGEPAATIELLELALDLARQELPDGRYQDKRGRPQG